jgi:hypothetical protein
MESLVVMGGKFLEDGSSLIGVMGYVGLLGQIVKISGWKEARIGMHKKRNGTKAASR